MKHTLIISLLLCSLCATAQEAATPKQKTVSIIIRGGFQAYNTYPAGLRGIQPAAAAIIIVPYKRFSFQYQAFYAPRGTWAHRVGVDYLLGEITISGKRK